MRGSEDSTAERWRLRALSAWRPTWACHVRPHRCCPRGAGSRVQAYNMWSATRTWCCARSDHPKPRVRRKDDFTRRVRRQQDDMPKATAIGECASRGITYVDLAQEGQPQSNARLQCDDMPLDDILCMDGGWGCSWSPGPAPELSQRSSYADQASCPDQDRPSSPSAQVADAEEGRASVLQRLSARVSREQRVSRTQRSSERAEALLPGAAAAAAAAAAGGGEGERSSSTTAARVAECTDPDEGRRL